MKISADQKITRLEFERQVADIAPGWSTLMWAGPSAGVAWSNPNFNKDRPSPASIINVLDKDNAIIAQFVAGPGFGAGGDLVGTVRYDNFIAYDPKWDLVENGAAA